MTSGVYKRKGHSFYKGQSWEERYGKERAKKIKKKLSISTKGVTWEQQLGEERADEKRRKLVARMIGKTIGKGNKMSEINKQKLRKRMLNNKYSVGAKPNKTSFKKGHKPWLKDKIASDDLRILCGERHPNWLGGISYNPYEREFDKELKEQIHKRDRYRCQQCFRHQNELKRKLSVHHIDFNKKNNNPNNLISLCTSCHVQTNYNREDWIKYFQEMRLKSNG